MKQVILFIFSAVFLNACDTIDLYEKIKAFDRQQWYETDKPSFVFEVTDTASLYNIFVVIRHTDAYQYNNIWLNINTTPPGDTSRTQQLDLTLGNSAKGWLGVAMDDIIEHRILITNNPIPLKKGSYTFTLQQIMRDNPLRNILNAGVRVEKVK